MFKFYFLDDDIKHNTSFHSNTNTPYYDNLSIFLFTFCYANFSNYSLQPIVDSSCKKPLVICNSIFSILLNQIKAQRDLKIIVFQYKYSFKVISNH
jgi:hypothetical protein